MIFTIQPASGRLDKAVNATRKIALANPRDTFYLKFNDTTVNVSDALDDDSAITQYYLNRGEYR